MLYYQIIALSSFVFYDCMHIFKIPGDTKQHMYKAYNDRTLIN